MNRLLFVLLVLCTLGFGSGDIGAAEPAVSLPDMTLEQIDLVDFRGRVWKLDDFEDDSILVVAFLGTECPLAKLYSVRLREIAEKYSERSVRVIAVMSNRQDSLEEIGAFAMRQEIEFPILKDAGNRFADRVGAERTPEMFVFDGTRKLRYRGRVDDQYGIGYVRDEPRRKDLCIALDELLSGGDVSLKRTAAPGCIIGRSKKVTSDSHVTYGGKVAEILNNRCVECHRDGEIAPFSLTDYDEVAGWSDMIKEVVREGRMPPWHATGEHAKFANDRTLSDKEKNVLYAWADAGAPAGDLNDLPKPPKKVEGWQLPREPDHVFPVSASESPDAGRLIQIHGNDPEPFEVPATGTVRYKYFSVDPGFEEDVWIEAAELKPGNREVVHHILAFAVPKGQRIGNGARGFLFGYVPGARVEPTPEGHAKKIPAGSQLIFQVHYTPIGTPQKDNSLLGLVLADPDKVTHEIVTTSAVQPRLNIPPGKPDFKTFASSPAFPADATLLSMSPHMHVRGKSYRYELETPDGKETILDIPAYDFNWQTTYALAEPLRVPAGSKFLCTAIFDNSEGNPGNPAPKEWVHWGDQTWDEMMIGYYHYSVPLTEKLGTGNGKEGRELSRRERAAALIRNANRLKVFDRIDRDGDGKLAREDTPKTLLSVFKQLDANKDDTLTRDEVAFGD